MLASSGDAALEGILAASIVVPLSVLAVVVWLFARSARRFDAQERRDRARSGEAASSE